MNREYTEMWVTGSTEEWFDGEEYSSKEAAVEGGREEYNGDGFFVGRKVRIKFEKSDGECFADHVIDRLGDMLYEELGEASECWQPTGEQEDDLEQALGKTILDWIRKHSLQPTTCFFVVDIFDVGPELGGER